eukprot:1153094-Pelagomonas_calceolata.AAC.1
MPPVDFLVAHNAVHDSGSLHGLCFTVSKRPQGSCCSMLQTLNGLRNTLDMQHQQQRRLIFRKNVCIGPNACKYWIEEKSLAIGDDSWRLHKRTRGNWPVSFSLTVRMKNNAFPETQHVLRVTDLASGEFLEARKASPASYAT